MELRLDPEIPVTRVVNGHNVFNKILWQRESC